MHVLGLPPAFVLSQDQTLNLKCLILVFYRLGSSFQAYCEAFLFTQTLITTGCPAGCASVKVSEPQCQSLLRPYDHRWSGTIRQDPAACVSLPSNSIVKEQSQTATTQRPDDTEQKSIQRRSWPRKTTNSHPADWPFENQKKIEDWTPCRASATPQCRADELNKQYHSARVNACFTKTSDSFQESN